MRGFNDIYFVSECQKKSHFKTRAVLDAFCSRIGSYTWVGRLPSEAVDYVHQELRRTASKNTAVSCHQVHKNKTELKWIVGSRSKFDIDGIVPINSTEKMNEYFLD